MLRLHVRRRLSERLDGPDHGPGGSIDKILMTWVEQTVGPRRSPCGIARGVDGDDVALKIYLYSRAQSVMGGTSQIQKNIIAHADPRPSGGLSAPVERRSMDYDLPQAFASRATAPCASCGSRARAAQRRERRAAPGPDPSLPAPQRRPDRPRRGHHREGRAFSAGGDFNLLDRMCTTARSTRRDRGGPGARAQHDPLPGPRVAAVNGPAVGLGCSVIALSDVVYMAESAYLSDPHVMVGLVAADGGPLTWPLHTSLLLAKEYAFTGDRIGAARARRSASRITSARTARCSPLRSPPPARSLR
jgi:hypothetical protein